MSDNGTPDYKPPNELEKLKGNTEPLNGIARHVLQRER